MAVAVNSEHLQISCSLCGGGGGVREGERAESNPSGIPSGKEVSLRTMMGHPPWLLRMPWMWYIFLIQVKWRMALKDKRKKRLGQSYICWRLVLTKPFNGRTIVYVPCATRYNGVPACCLGLDPSLGELGFSPQTTGCVLPPPPRLLLHHNLPELCVFPWMFKVQ